MKKKSEGGALGTPSQAAKKAGREGPPISGGGGKGAGKGGGGDGGSSTRATVGSASGTKKARKKLRVLSTVAQATRKTSTNRATQSRITKCRLGL